MLAWAPVSGSRPAALQGGSQAGSRCPPPRPSESLHTPSCSNTPSFSPSLTVFVTLGHLGVIFTSEGGAVSPLQYDWGFCFSYCQPQDEKNDTQGRLCSKTEQITSWLCVCFYF